MSPQALSFDPPRTALQVALLCAVLALPSALASLLDTRALYEVNVWSKPLKFQLSFALHWLTVAWLLHQLDRAAFGLTSLRWWLRVGGAAAVVEVLYITLQAARGRASHFNFSTPEETILYYALMGGAALLMMFATLWIGWLVWRHPRDPQRGALWFAAVVGLIWGSAITLLVTAPLAAGAIDGPGHWVGGVRSDALGLPLAGWSTTGGDLRVPHFFAVHLLQLLPVTAWLVVRWRLPRPRVWVAGMLLLGVAVVLATFVQAVQGRPFWSP